MPNAKRREKLTKTMVEKLHPQTKEYKIWDTEVPGFFIRVLPSGMKSFGVFYRDERGRQRKPTLGNAAHLHVADAAVEGHEHGHRRRASRKKSMQRC